MKFWVLARGEKFEEQLLVSAESTDDLRKCLESLLHVSIRQMSITDFQVQVLDKLVAQQGGSDIIVVNLRTQPASTGGGGASTGVAANPQSQTPRGDAACANAAEASFVSGSSSGNAFGVFAEEPPAALSRTNSQSRMSSGPQAAASTAVNSAGGGGAHSVANGPPLMNASRRGSGTASELFNADLMLPIDRICLTREAISTLLSSTFRGTFHDVVRGCFVRVRGASSLATSASGYAVVQVVSISSDTQVGLDLVHVVEVRHLDVVSNSPPTADELRMWAKHMLHAGRSPVTNAFIESKLLDVNDALRTAATTFAGANLSASMSFSSSGGGGPPLLDRNAREREPTIGAPWEGSLTTDDANPSSLGAMNLDESPPPQPATGSVAGSSGGKLRRRQTMSLHPQNFLMSFSADGGEGTTAHEVSPLKVSTAPPPPATTSKGNSPSNAGLFVGTSPSHNSSSMLLRAHMAINQALEVVVSDDDDLNVSDAEVAVSLPPPPPLQAATSAKSLIKQRLDSISQAMSQHQQRMQTGGGDVSHRRAGSGSRVVDPSLGPVTPQSARNSSNEQSPQSSSHVVVPSPAAAPYSLPPPPPASSATLLEQSLQSLTVGGYHAIPPLAPPPSASLVSSPATSVASRHSAVALNDSLLSGWLLQHPIEDGSFEYMLFGTRHSNPKARRARTADFAGCCISLIDQDEGEGESEAPPSEVDPSASLPRRLFHSTLYLKGDVDRDVTVKGFIVHCTPQLFRGTFVALASNALEYLYGDHKSVAGGGSEGESPATSPHRATEDGGAASPAPGKSAAHSAPDNGTGLRHSNAYEFTVLSGRDVTSLYNPPFKTHLPVPSWGAPMSQPQAVIRPQLVFASGVLHVFYLVGLGQSLVGSAVAAAPVDGPRRKGHHPQPPTPKLLYGLAHAICSDARLASWTLLSPTEPIAQQHHQASAEVPRVDHGLVPLFSVVAGCIPTMEEMGTEEGAARSDADGLTLMWCEPRVLDGPQHSHVPPAAAVGGRFRSPSGPRAQHDADGNAAAHSGAVPTPPQRSQSPPPRDDVGGLGAPLNVTPPRRRSLSISTLSERPVFPLTVMVNVDDSFRCGAWTPHDCVVADLAAAVSLPLTDRCVSALDDITRHPQGIKCMSLVRRQHRHQQQLLLQSVSSGAAAFVKPPEVDNALLVVVGEDRHHRATVLLLPAKVQ